VPKIPFVLGGPFEATNLYAADAVKAMRFYGNLASQIRELPDGQRSRSRSSTDRVAGAALNEGQRSRS
jgi:hypothetical protein